MLDTILYYATLIFAVACFTIIYFKLLRSTVNRVTASGNEGKVATVYTSFLARLVLAFLFFYCLLKYYSEIRDIIVMVIVFIFVRYLVVRHEKAVFLAQKISTKNKNKTGFSNKKSVKSKNTKSAVSTGKSTTKIRAKKSKSKAR